MYILDWLARYLGLTTNALLPYDKLILLTGILHAIEGFLITQYGERDYKIANYNKIKIAGGYQLYRKWYVPLLFFSVKGIYIPILMIMTYGDETYVMKPKEKVNIMGFITKLYGCLIMIIGIAIRLGYLSTTVGILFMCLFHELMFGINEQIEKHDPVHIPPAQGIRIVATSESTDFNNPFSRGDIIESINDKQINDITDYQEAISTAEEPLYIKICTLEGEPKTVQCDISLLKKVDNIFLPPKSGNKNRSL